MSASAAVDALRAQYSPPSEGVAQAILEGERASAAAQHALARSHYEAALYLMRTEDDARHASMVLRRIGRAWLDEGEFDSGFDVLDAALAVANARGDIGDVAHATNIIAIGHWQRGDLRQAEDDYVRANELAIEAGEERLSAMIAQNRGVLANIRGDTAKALEHYERSLAGYRALGMTEYVAGLLANVGMAYRDLEQWTEAQAKYREGLTISDATGDRATGLMLKVNLAEALTATRDLTQARLVVEEVLREARDVGDTRALGEGYKQGGAVAREMGSFDEAETLLAEAASLADARQDLMLAAETAREQAMLYAKLHRNRETLQSLGTAHRLFSKLRARRDIVDVARRLGKLEERFQDVVTNWARSIEAKDRYTYGHSERVAAYACMLAEAMHVDPAGMFWFRLGALLHDVGKIVVPSDILNKAGQLTSAERAIMQRHPVAGVDLLRDVDFPWDVLPMVRSHHERWDGGGYPDGLRGEEIPINARILCVADVFDALTSSRPYRSAFRVADAVEVMLADQGAFDPVVLARFRDLVPMLPTRDGLTPQG